jgi:hypothetical protein
MEINTDRGTWKCHIEIFVSAKYRAVETIITINICQQLKKKKPTPHNPQIIYNFS